MSALPLAALIALPVVIGALSLLLPPRRSGGSEACALIAALANVALALYFFVHRGVLELGTLGLGIDLVFRNDAFASFIVLAASGFGLLVTLYSVPFMRHRPGRGQFYFYLLLNLGFANGVALADNLVVLLFFWEGLLVAMFAMIVSGSVEAFPTATKAFVIVGVTDLCLMLGIVLAGSLASTLRISAIHLPAAGVAGAAFVLMMIGAIGKAGAMPFHSWIPNAATDAPLPFMALLPASLEKLLGIYLLARISLELFALEPGSWVSLLLMIIGAITILFAVMMALAQKDFKRLLSYHAISQVGYMVLGIGTGLPVGIVGGLFHMINHAMYKSCLFLTGGAVEHRVGTTELAKLGGIGRSMPVTFTSFIIAAAAISGVPPLNGFFSKELVYDGALESHWLFYAAALLGSFLTAASFLKLGHAAFLGKPPAAARERAVREAPWPMLVPMLTLAALCVLFGLYNPLPLRGLVEPALGARLGGASFAGLPRSVPLVIGTLVALTAALLNHLYGVRQSGSGAGAADHITHAPLLASIYAAAERGRIDPYELGGRAIAAAARLLHVVDRAVDWCYDRAVAAAKRVASRAIGRLHTGKYANYLVWALAGVLLLALIVVR